VNLDMVTVPPLEKPLPPTRMPAVWPPPFALPEITAIVPLLLMPPSKLDMVTDTRVPNALPPTAMPTPPPVPPVTEIVPLLLIRRRTPIS
jgi:hypothetical protein